MCNLKTLFLSGNHLNGQLDFIQNLTRCANHSIEPLHLRDNPLEGVISEAHFSKLTKLKNFDLSNTLLDFNINFDWVPPFQLEVIGLGSCQLSPKFPKWLQTPKKKKKKKNLYFLDIFNSRILDALSNSNWIFSSQLWFLNLSHNQISG